MSKKGKKPPRPESILKDPELLKRILDQVATKVAAHREPLAAARENLVALTRLVRAWLDGKYRDVPWKSLVMIAGALLYFLNPLDLIPDFILGGFMDDLTVLSGVLAAVKSDLDRFLSWEQAKQRAPSA